jgi:hypothetical protein
MGGFKERLITVLGKKGGGGNYAVFYFAGKDFFLIYIYINII